MWHVSEVLDLGGRTSSLIGEWPGGWGTRRFGTMKEDYRCYDTSGGQDAPGQGLNQEHPPLPDLQRPAGALPLGF